MLTNLKIKSLNRGTPLSGLLIQTFFIMKAYLAAAKMLAEKEVNVTLAALANSEQKDEKLKHLFDLLLVLKPYLLNMKTFNLYQAESAK